MRELRYYLELSDVEHRDEAPISLAVAEGLLRAMDWKLPRPGEEDGDEPRAPFMLFLDEGESFFMIMPEDGGLRVTARVLDKWNLLGLVKKDKAFTLNFGVLPVDDTLSLLKLFYEDDYAALRAQEKKLA